MTVDPPVYSFDPKTGAALPDNSSPAPASTASATAAAAAPVAASSDSPQTLYGPNGQVATPDSSTTQDQVRAAIAAGWSTTAPQPSDPNKPSSSANVPLSAAANSAAQNAASTTLPGTPTAAAKSLANLASTFGMNVQAGDIQGLLDSNPGMTASDAFSLLQQGQGIKDAQTSAANQTAQQNNIYNAELAQQNSEYASQSATLNQDRTNARSTAAQQLAALNTSGGIGSDSGQFMSHIDAQFDLAGQQLTLQAQQAKAALDAGNAQAYQQIQANMANTIATVRANVSNLLNGIQASNVAQGQFQQQEKDKATTAYRDTLTQLPLSQADQMSSLPSDWDKLSPSQQNTIQGTTAYQQGKSAGLSDQAILGDMRTLSSSGSFAQQKIQNQAVQAQARLAIAQANLADKQAGTIDAATLATAPGGGDFLSAFQLAQAGTKMTAQQNSDTLSTIARFAQSGDLVHARQALTNYIFGSESSTVQSITSGLQDVSGYSDKLKAKISALPADQQSGFLQGNFADIAAKFGQNPDPQLKELGQEFGHLGLIYKAEVFGKRALVSNDSTLSNLFPTITDNNSLNWTTLTAMQNTANDILNGKVQSKIGGQLFQNIYGDGGVLGNQSKAPSSQPANTTQMIGPGGTFYVPNDKVSVFTQNGYK